MKIKAEIIIETEDDLTEEFMEEALLSYLRKGEGSSKTLSVKCTKL